MAKVKVFQLAKELNLSSKELLYYLEEFGIIVKSHMSVLADDEVDRVKQAFAEKKAEVKKKKVIVRKKTQPSAISAPTSEEIQETPSKVTSEVQHKKEKVEIAKPEEILEPTVVEKPKEEVSEKQISKLEVQVTPEEPEKIEEPKGKEVEEEKPKKKKKKAKEKEILDIDEVRKRKKPSTAKKRHRHIVIEMFEEEPPLKKIPEPEVAKPVKPVAKKEKRPKEKEKKTTAPRPVTAPTKAIKRRVEIGESITVAELAKAMGVKASEVIKKLIGLGVMATINQPLDYDTAALVASEFDYEVRKVGFVEEDVLKPIPDKPEDLKPRPPVVTVMGHVDHGKTSLLDAIRHTNVIATEAGGITQHIGAYYVTLDKGDVVFLDTPGHEAFTAMRARGAQVTDVVILIVAADDGVMDQTREAINHAKEAGVPIVVAINKVDKPNANPERVKRQLAELGLVPEEWGGETLFAEISAKKRIGIEDLLELVLLQAEMLELKANPNKPARGVVVEARLDKGRGPVATVLIKEGTLKVGDHFVCGLHYGKVRAMFNDRGEPISEAGPSMPVEIQGISGVPEAGDRFVVVESEKVAKEVSQYRQQKQREAALIKMKGVSLENLYEKFKEGEVKELKIIVKADVQGSVEALKESLSKLSTDEIKINVIHASTGAITESDILLASASHAIVIGFNMRPTAKVMDLAQKEKVDVRYYNVIYRLLNDIKDAMSGMLEPEYKEKVIGEAEIRQIFKVPKVGMVAGCYVTNGKIERGANVRVLRDGVVVYDGKLASLKRFKEDVKEVAAGYECGMGFENFQDIKVGDTVEAYIVEEVKRTIDFQTANE
ncbi:MAG: translation initiation factor IF-2 [Candidatus Desulfofervidaceae bacterium]|nr:translation initiation factor IF-2 [Candidatus Desulfofervidaceae bacterium]